MGLFDSNTQDQPTSTANNASMWGGIANAAASIFQTATTSLNPKVRENQLAIAEANAAAAQANAQSTTANAFDPKIIIFGVIVLVLIIALMMRSKK